MIILKIVNSLKAWNKLGFVDGTIKRDTTDAAKSSKWECVNVVVCSWILCSLSEFIYYSHAYSESVEEVWNELFETYNKSDGCIIFNIHQQINSLTQNGSSLLEYFNSWSLFGRNLMVLQT